MAALEKYSVEQDSEGHYYLVARYPLQEPYKPKKENSKYLIIGKTDSSFDKTGLQYGDKAISHSGIWLIPA